MMQVNILEAKTNLSNLVRLIETGKEEFPYYTQKTRHFGIFVLDVQNMKD